MKEEIFHHLALILLPNIGNSNSKYLVSHCGSAKAVFDSNKKTLLKIPGIGEKAISSIQSQESFVSAEKIIESCEKLEIDILPYTSDRYPNLLKNVLDAPNILYFKGTGELNYDRSIAIVGTRKATTYGKDTTETIVSDLQPYRPSIISGLAYGIDIAAHKASLINHLPTFAVIAGGIDQLYPRTHQKIANEMMNNAGGVISEQPPGIKPEAHLFPMRNRIIAGMTDATIVVEAALKGGALITANIADSYNRTVFAIPGNLDNPYSAGCNKLIQSQKALIYAGIETIEYNLNWSKQRKNDKHEVPDDLDENEQKIYNALSKKKHLMIDDLAWQSQLHINQTASVLLNMEFKGLVKSYPGKRFGLTKVIN